MSSNNSLRLFTSFILIPAPCSALLAAPEGLPPECWKLASICFESEIELEFEKFGKIRPNGMVIRGRKDLGVCYAFVEFEDMGGVNNAVKAGSAHIGGQEVFIEERRPNSNIPSQGRRGRVRGTHQAEISRDHFGSRRVGGYSGGDREYIKPRGNGHRQDRAFTGRQSSRVNQDLEE